MSTAVRRIVAAVLMLVGIVGAFGTGTATQHRGPSTTNDSLGAPSRSAAPAEAVAPADTSRVIDGGQPNRSRHRWLADVLATLLVAAGALRGGRGRLAPQRVRGGSGAAPARPALGRAPPATI